ncbi:hypothetical protein U722_18890 [Bacillus amyloliquefaciens LFB112]|nr:hypothetical protein U722_18890 [Bacillus amyloliquefaciens LFB112]
MYSGNPRPALFLCARQSESHRRANGDRYEEKTERKADFYTADIGAGARELKGDDDGN